MLGDRLVTRVKNLQKSSFRPLTSLVAVLNIVVKGKGKVMVVLVVSLALAMAVVARPALMTAESETEVMTELVVAK